jgi:hypothetical protein
MFSIRVRPRIKRFTNTPIDEVLDCFTDVLESNEFNLDGTLLKNHVIVKIPDEIHHYWSPELQLEVNDNHLQDDDYSDHREKTMIRGFIGPKSTVWTMFMFFYTVFGVLTLFGVVLGSSQQMLDQDATGYWYAILGGIGLVIAFLASQIGQRMGHEQTKILISLTDKVFAQCNCTVE